MIVRTGNMAGFVGFGDLADEYPALYARLNAARKKIEEQSLRQLQGSIPFSQYARVVDEQARTAAAARDELDDIGTATPAMRKEVAAIAGELRDLADVAAKQAAKTPNGRITPTRALNLVKRLQAVYNSLLGVAIAQHAAIVPKVAALPKKAKKAATEAISKLPELPLELLNKGLGIPKWFVPVALTVVGAAFLLPYVAPGIMRSLKGGSR